MLRVSVFVGPSVPVDRVTALLPSATVHPPAEQGDLLAAVERDHADVLGLIDGTFHQNLSVWHSEVCHLLSRGVTVYGASSMGALRAVETERFGTVGVGRVYRWYRDGIITGDDEVALLHGDADSGYRAMSEPLVNIRASLEHAVETGALPAAAAAHAVRVAQALYYPDRRIPAIVEACREGTLAGEHVAAVRHALTDGYVDVKRLDALELLATIAEVVSGARPRPAPVHFRFNRSSVFDTMYTLDRKVRAGGRSITLQAVAEHAALFSADYEAVRRSAVDRAVVLFVAQLLGLEVTPEEFAAERAAFLARQELATVEALHDWLRRNRLTESDLGEWLTQEAMCRRLRRWVVAAGSLDRGCKILLDELRMRGQFAALVNEAIEYDEIVDAYRGQPDYADVWTEHPAVLAERHATYGHRRIVGDARVWAESAGFEDVSALADKLRTAAVYNDVRARAAQHACALSVALGVDPALDTSSGPEACAEPRERPCRPS